MTQPRWHHDTEEASGPHLEQTHKMIRLGGTSGDSAPSSASAGPARDVGAADHAEFLRRLDDVAHLVTGEWTNAILVVLSDGPKRYTDIRDTIRALHTPYHWSGRPRVLHASALVRTLKTLTAHRLIEREQLSNSFPPSVQYTLAPATAEMLAAWKPVVAWARTHADLIDQAQRRHRNHDAV